MSTVRWAVRLCKQGQTPPHGLPEFVLACGKRWTTTARADAYEEATRWDTGRVVKLTSKPKAKAAERQVWDGTVREFEEGRCHIQHANKAGSSDARFSGWLHNHIGKRVRVTSEVLP